MNVVIHRYNSICEPDYIRAFKQIGLTVIEDREEMTRKSIPGDERVETMARLILENRPLFVFTINFFPYISEICERLKVFYLCVSADCPVEEIYDPAIRNSMNRVFLFDRAQYLSVCGENPAGIFHLPLGADVERIEEEIGAFEDFARDPQYDYDVSFIGPLYNEPTRKPEDRGTSEDRISLLNGLAAGLPEAGVHLFTRSDTDALTGVHCHGGVKTNAEMPTVFRTSRINLHTTMRGIKTGLPQRVWDILGSGGFLLSDAQEEIPEYLTVGKHLDVYENREEAEDKAGYWLSHEEERRQIARAGYEEVRAHHKVLDRVIAMIGHVVGKMA
jgi:hypothetical protein